MRDQRVKKGLKAFMGSSPIIQAERSRDIPKSMLSPAGGQWSAGASQALPKPALLLETQPMALALHRSCRELQGHPRLLGSPALPCPVRTAVFALGSPPRAKSR